VGRVAAEHVRKLQQELAEEKHQRQHCEAELLETKV
jgi:hypothetical protein